jgi:hypothetical protein
MTAFIEKLPEFDAGSYARFIEEAKAQGGDEGHHYDDEASAPEGHSDELHGHSHEENGHHH